MIGETERYVLIDENLYAFKAQPENGLWVHRWEGDPEDEGLWNILWVLFRCNFSSKIPATLEKMKHRDIFQNSKKEFKKLRMTKSELKRANGYLPKNLESRA